MATPKKIKIIFDESNPDGQTQELAQIQINTSPQLPSPVNSKLLRFSDLNQIFVKNEWIEKCPVLNQDIIYTDFELFKKYIRPTLNGESLRWSDTVDTKQEIGMLIIELAKYHLSLPEDKIIEVSDNSGITKTINEIKSYIFKHENQCWGKKTFKSRYDNFCKIWDKYIETLAIQYNDPVYREYKAQLIYNILTSDSMYNLCQINFKKNNIVYEYCDWFRSFIILQIDTFTDHVYELTSRLDITGNMNPTDIVTLILNMITNSKSENLVKGQLVQKIGDLLKFRSVSG